MDLLEELWSVVRCVELGEVASYGAVGQALMNPASGWQVGRWMTQCPAEVPWWRVVAKSGALPIGKRDPRFGVEQSQRLEQEGVIITNGLVAQCHFVDAERLADRAARSRLA